MQRNRKHQKQPAPILADAARLFADLLHESAGKTDDRVGACTATN